MRAWEESQLWPLSPAWLVHLTRAKPLPQMDASSYLHDWAVQPCWSLLNNHLRDRHRPQTTFYVSRLILTQTRNNQNSHQQTGVGLITVAHSDSSRLHLHPTEHRGPNGVQVHRGKQQDAWQCVADTTMVGAQGGGGGPCMSMRPHQRATGCWGPQLL